MCDAIPALINLYHIHARFYPGKGKCNAFAVIS